MLMCRKKKFLCFFLIIQHYLECVPLFKMLHRSRQKCCSNFQLHNWVEKGTLAECSYGWAEGHLFFLPQSVLPAISSFPCFSSLSFPLSPTLPPLLPSLFLLLWGLSLLHSYPPSLPSFHKYLPRITWPLTPPKVPILKSWPFSEGETEGEHNIRVCWGIFIMCNGERRANRTE